MLKLALIAELPLQVSQKPEVVKFCSEILLAKNSFPCVPHLKGFWFLQNMTTALAFKVTENLFKTDIVGH